MLDRIAPEKLERQDTDGSLFVSFIVPQLQSTTVFNSLHSPAVGSILKVDSLVIKCHPHQIAWYNLPEPNFWSNSNRFGNQKVKPVPNRSTGRWV